MQYQMSGLPAPTIAPPPAAAPQPTPLAPPPPRRRYWWLAALTALLAAGAGLFYWLRQASTHTQPAAAAGVRTARAWSGAVERTIRLTGTTAAEHAASLVTPQLRGSRGGGSGGGSLREGRTFQSGINTNYQVSPNTSRSGSSGSSSTASSSSADSGAGAGSSVASTAGSSSVGASSAMRAATSRIPRGGGSSSPSSSSSSSAGGSAAASGSSVLGSEGLGSTSGSLGAGMGGGGTGGAGGAGGEFMLVLQWLIKPGTFVKKGTVVAEFDRQYMLQRLEDFRASLAQTEASLIKLKAEIDVGRKAHQQTIATAKAELDKARLDLKTTPVLGAIEAERLRLAAEEAEAKYKQLLSEVPLMETKFRATIRAAELEVQQMRLELRRAEMNAERMVVKAPIDGITVMQSTFRGGELAPVQQGDQLFPGSIFMHIVDPRSMLINAVLNQVDADQVRVGARARVRFDAYPGMELPAHVYSIGAMTRPGGFRANYVREIPVQLKLDRMDPRVIPDLAVSVDVVIETEQQAAAVTPRSAIFTGENGKPFVFVKQGEEFEERPVELGVMNNIVAAIRSGLRVGEEVAAEMPPRERIKGKGSS